MLTDEQIKAIWIEHCFGLDFARAIERAVLESKPAEASEATLIDALAKSEAARIFDAARLDFLDQNARFKMGWEVVQAPAGNLSVRSVIQLAKPPTPIRDAIDAASRVTDPTPAPPVADPIDMVLHCPACGLQHIDAPEELPMPMPGSAFEGSAGWINPPHRSHLCHGCGHIWRPADVPTNGVAAVKTKGKADSAPPVAAAPGVVASELVRKFENAVNSCTHYHTEYQGKEMPERVSESFFKLRDEIIPKLRAELIAALATPPASPVSEVPTDPQLCEFYGVSADAELIAAQARHIEKLQAKLPPTPSMAPQRVREG